MPVTLQCKLVALTEILSNGPVPGNQDDLFGLIHAALRQALGDIQVLFYLGNPPPHLAPRELLPCSARRLDDDLFVRDALGRQQDFCIGYGRPYCTTINAASHTFGLLYVDRIGLPLTEAEQTIVALMAAQTGHYLLYMDRIENLGDQDGQEASCLIVDEACRQIRINGSALCLKGKQWALLQLLYRHRGHICSRKLIHENLYANHQACGNGRENRLDLLIHKLRKKLRQIGHNPIKIETVRGRGYRLKLKS